LDRDGGPFEDVRQDSLFKEYFEFQWTTKDRRAPVFQSGISKVRWMTLTVENERNLLCFVDEEQVGKVIVSNKGEDYQSFTKDLAIGESKTAGQNDSLTLIDIDMPLGTKKELYFITLRMQLTVIDD